MRIHDEHIDIGQAPERLDGGGTGIARGRASDRHLACPISPAAKQLTDQLHGEILEGQRRAVEQLKQMMPGAALIIGARDMIETGIGAGDRALSLILGEAVADAWMTRSATSS